MLRIRNRLRQPYVQHMELPRAPGESFFTGSRVIGKTVKFLELVLLEQARRRTHVIAGSVDLSAEVAVQASVIRLADVAWV